MKKFCFIISILVAIPLAMAFLRGYKDSQSLMSQPLYETMFFVMKGYGVCHWQQADSIEQIIDYLENDCIMEDGFKENVDLFFKFIDRNNCERVYKWILEH